MLCGATRTNISFLWLFVRDLIIRKVRQERLDPMAILPPHDLCHLTFLRLSVEDLTQRAGQARETVSDGNLYQLSLVEIEGTAIMDQLRTI